MYENYSTKEFEEALENDENAVVLDVRTPMEFSEGFIPGAINMDYLSGEFAGQLSNLEKDKNYYVYCRSGARSASVCSILEKSGIKNAINLQDGILSWTGELKK